MNSNNNNTKSYWTQCLCGS